MTRAITLLTGNHLCHNPRVMKAAASLARSGYRVEVLGAWSDRALKARDQRLSKDLPFTFRAVTDLTDSGPLAFMRRLFTRGRSKTRVFAYRWMSIESRYLLGHAVDPMLRYARRIGADLNIAHSEAGLYVAARLAHSGWRVGVDMEDWFSEDLPPGARRGRPTGLLRSLERDVLSASDFRSCPSRAMSAALAEAFSCEQPQVIYNAFPWGDRESIDGLHLDRGGVGPPSIYWYSQTLGEGRGLEDLAAALPSLAVPAEVYLRGHVAGDYVSGLLAQLPSPIRQRVHILDLVENNDLLSRIAEHDVGFAGETRESASRNLTVTNKLLHYLLGGLAVVASDTLGQVEVASCSGGGVALYRIGNPKDLARALNGLLAAPGALQSAKAASLDAARRAFCWERQEAALLEGVEQALRQR